MPHGDPVLFTATAGDPQPRTWSSTYASAGNLIQSDDRVLVLQKEIEALKARVEELEKEKINREGVAYFQRKLHGALKIPESAKLGWEMDKIDIGPNDLLVVYLNVRDIPNNRVEIYMKQAKQSLAAAFEERGLKGRSLWIPTRDRDSGFGAIGIERADEMLTKQDVGEARRILRQRRKPQPPVMG